MPSASIAPAVTFDFMPAKSALTPDIPWPGAAPYGTADRAFFHGRKRDTEELLRLIHRDVITLVMGEAGVGKTSLIQAGLLPALAETEWMPVVPKLDWSATPPKSDAPDLDPDSIVSLANPLSRKLIDTLLAAAAERKFTSPEPEQGETLWEYFHRAGNRWWSTRQRVVTPIVIIDEFESVFTTATENATAERHAAAFLKELSELAANRPPQRLATRLENGSVSESAYNFDPVPLRIVLVMRDEFASQLRRLRSLFPNMRRSELRIEPFSTAQARDVLMRGSLQVSLMSDATLDAVVAHLSSDRGISSEISPAKLSVLAHSLALARRERGVPQIKPDFLPKVDQATAPPAEAPANPTAEASNLRAELAASENRRRSSQRITMVAALAALVAVAAPFVKDQFSPPKAVGSDSDAAAAASRGADLPPPPATHSTEPTIPFESPFSVGTPEFLPAVPTSPATPVPSTPEPTPKPPPVELISDEPPPHLEKQPGAPPHPYDPPVDSSPAKPSAATPQPASPAPSPSALSPDAQRLLNNASADRKEQQRREFLRKQQEGRKTKENTAR